MESVVAYGEEFWRCVKYHTNKWYATAQNEISNFSNVDAYVIGEQQAAESLRQKLATAREQLARDRSQSETDIAKAKQDVIDMRSAYSIRARPLLTRYDEISLSKHYYSELLNLVGNQEYGAQQLHSRETSNYGYQSKKLISLSLTLEALKHHVRRGEPFAKELRAIVEDSDSPDIAIVTAPLQAVAAVGLPLERDLRRSANILARAMEDAAKSSPVDTAQSWMDRFKFRTVTQPNVSQSQQAQIAMARDAARLFLAKADEGQWGAALELAAKGISSMTTANISSNAAYSQSLQQFRQLAMPYVAASQFVSYADASLATAQLAYVEDLLRFK